MATILWHPDAKKQIFSAKGKPWHTGTGGSGKPKYLDHMTETRGFPNYKAPPHMTTNLFTGELRQHIPFNLAAYAVRDGLVDIMKFVYQIEHIGYSALVRGYPDIWYKNKADLMMWFHLNLGVPLQFADFSIMRYGQWAKQRMNRAEVDAFSGILGHAHVGRGRDTHWDPGKLDIDRLQTFLIVPPPPEPPPQEEEEGYELALTTPEWVSTLRPVDMDRANKAGIITAEEATYWKGLLDQPFLKDWENYRRAVEVRRV